MSSEKCKYHYVYKITNNINNKFYYGVHNTNNLNDNYMGSGIKLNEAFKKYGKENFTKEIIKFFDTSKEAFEYEKVIVTDELIKDSSCYNIQPGGEYVQKEGYVIVKDPNDPNEKLFTVSVSDPRYISGELIYMFKNKAIVKDKENNIKWVDKNNIPEDCSGIQKGKIVVKDEDNNTYCVDVFDERYVSGELVPIAKGKITVKTKDEKYLCIDKNDPRYISGELKFMFKDTKIAKDSSNNHIRVSVDDPRFKTGELVGILKGKTLAKDKEGNKIWVSVDDERLKTGELVGHTKGHKASKESIKKRVEKTKGRIFINNGIVNKFLPVNEANEYLNTSNTWVRGMIYKPRKKKKDGKNIKHQ